MGTRVSQITSLTIVYSTVYSGADQRKHQSSVSLAFVQGIHRWSVNSPHKGPVTRKMSPFNGIGRGVGGGGNASYPTQNVMNVGQNCRTLSLFYPKSMDQSDPIWWNYVLISQQCSMPCTEVFRAEQMEGWGIIWWTRNIYSLTSPQA